MGYAEVVRRLMEAQDAMNLAMKACQSAHDPIMFKKIYQETGIMNALVEECFTKGADAIRAGDSIKVV